MRRVRKAAAPVGALHAAVLVPEMPAGAHVGESPAHRQRALIDPAFRQRAMVEEVEAATAGDEAGMVG